MKVSAVVVVVVLSACGIDEPQISSIESKATSYLLGGEYYYQTDHFSEQCGAGTLGVLTGGGPTWSNVPRGDVTYLKPLTFTGGELAWRCGTSHEWSECDESPAG